MSSGVPRDRHGGSFDRRKRRHSGASSSHGVEDDVGIEHTQLVQLIEEQDRQLRALRSPIHSSAAMGVFDMQNAEEKAQLAVQIWTADLGSSMAMLRTANAALVDILREQMANATTQTEISRIHKEKQLDGTLLNIVRGQSIHKVPLITAALSITCESNLVKREFHDSISFLMKGALMSETWVQSFMDQAARSRPAPTETMIPGVMVTTFDNLTMNVGYHSYSVGGQTGDKLDMTNWFAVRIPQRLSPNLDGMRLCTEPAQTLERFTPAVYLLVLTHSCCILQSRRASLPMGSRWGHSADYSISTIPRSSQTRSHGGEGTSKRLPMAACWSAPQSPPSGSHTRSTDPRCQTGCSLRMRMSSMNCM